MGKGVCIVSSKTDSLELREFMDLILVSRDKKNSLEKTLPQLFQGREIAVHLEDTKVNLKKKGSYLLDGRFEANVQSVAEQLGTVYDVRHGIQPLSDNGIVYLIKHYVVVKKRR